MGEARQTLGVALLTPPNRVLVVPDLAVCFTFLKSGVVLGAGPTLEAVGGAGSITS